MKYILMLALLFPVYFWGTSAEAFQYEKGPGKLTKANLRRMRTLDIAAKKYIEVVGACTFNYRDREGKIAATYRPPKEKGSLPFGMYMQLTQLIDGWAIYNQFQVDTTYMRFAQFIVAVRRSSIRGKLRQGDLLFPSTNLPCLGRLKDTTAKNLRGFPIKMRRYEAIYP